MVFQDPCPKGPSTNMTRTLGLYIYIYAIVSMVVGQVLLICGLEPLGLFCEACPKGPSTHVGPRVFETLRPKNPMSILKYGPTTNIDGSSNDVLSMGIGNQRGTRAADSILPAAADNGTENYVEESCSAPSCPPGPHAPIYQQSPKSWTLGVGTQERALPVTALVRDVQRVQARACPSSLRTSYADAPDTS